jgi:hypothetical protein
MNKYFLLALMVMTMSNVLGLGAADAANKPKSKPTAVKGKNLTELLVQQLGVTKAQAEGGAGAIFQLAKSKMDPGAFARLSSSVPGMQTFMAAAGNGAGDLPSAFQKLGLATDMPQKFVPIVMKYVHGASGEAMASVLQAALMGGF